MEDLKITKFLNVSSLIILLILIQNLNLTLGQENELKVRIQCNPQWCEDAQIECPEKRLNCTKIGFRQMKSPERCNCCEYCFDYLEENQHCTMNEFSAPEHLCGPYLQCRNFNDNDGIPYQQCRPMIRPDNTSCNAELIKYNKDIEEGNLGVAQFKPACDAHGDYLPRQCLTGSICYCANEKGERIFGAGTIASRMNCACARDNDKIKSFGLEGTWPHCLSNGNYDQLQCSLRRRACYCISKPETSLPIQMWKTLPCYNAELHGNSYLKPCELRVAEIKIQHTEAELANKTLVYSDIPQCDPDGSYHPVQSWNSTNWICVDGDGNPLVDDENNDTPYTAEKTALTPSNMNCNCARARYIVLNSSNKPKCCKNGSYRPWQCTGSTCYCVDPNTGKQNTEHPQVHIDNIEDLRPYCSVERC